MSQLVSAKPISSLISKDNSPLMEAEIRERYLYELIPEEDLLCENGYVHVFDGEDPTDNLWVQSVCSRPWCSRCEPIRVWRLRRKMEKYLEWHSPKHLWIVTRSVRNEPELVTSFNTLRAAQVAFAKSNKVDHHSFRFAQHWIATTEITYTHWKGYNVHEHMIWGTESARLPFKDFHVWWDRAAGFEGAHINIVKVQDSRHAVNYVAKYLSKGVWGGLSVGRAFLLRKALKGRNRINTKRGTVLPKKFSGYCLCRFTAGVDQCNGEGEMVTHEN